MLNEKRARWIFIITMVLFVSVIIVIWFVHIEPTIEKVYNEVSNAPNQRVQEALSEPVVSAGLYALDGQTGQVQWTVQFEGIRFSDPAVASDRIFIDIYTSNSVGLADCIFSESDFVAIEAETGHQLWHTANHGSHDPSVVVKYPPIATPDIMIDDTGYNWLGVYEADTGKLLYEIKDIAAWLLNADDALPVALAEDRLIVRHNLTSPRGIADTVRAYDLYSGDLLWSTSHEPYPDEVVPAVHLTPILTDNQRVFLEVVSQYQAFDIDSGDFLFALDQTCTQAKIQGSTLYCIDGDLKTFDTASGELFWSFDLDIDLQEVEAVEDTVYVTTTQAKRRQWLIALNPADGSERWRVRVWHVPPSAGEEMVFAIQIIKNQKALVALSSTDGTQLWQFPLYSDDRYSPVSDGEQVYIVDTGVR